MPGATGSKKFGRALRSLQSALDGYGAPWMVIGGVAVIARGVRRLTGDIDAVVRGDAVALPALLAALADQGIEPRIPDAVAFAQRNLVVLARHAATNVDLDLSLAWSRFEVEALEARDEIRFGGVRAPGATAEDLVIFKALAQRPKDVDDAVALLVMYPKIDLERVRDRLSELATVVDAPELVSGLEAIIKQALAARRRGR